MSKFSRYTDDEQFAALCDLTFSVIQQMGRTGTFRQDIIMAWKRAANPELFESGIPVSTATSRKAAASATAPRRAPAPAAVAAEPEPADDGDKRPKKLRLRAR